MNKIIWVAEIGSAHKGDKSLAYEMIRQFSEAGATICKFQFGWTKEAQEAMGLVYNPVRYVDEWAEELKAWCDYFDVELMASIWSVEGLIAAKNVDMKRYKIGYQLWHRNNKFGCEILADLKPTFISGASLRDIANWKHIYPIWVNSEYPTYPRGMYIPPKFDKYRAENNYGYSDHSHGIAPCLLAVARGALYIEKHVTLDKTDLTVRDTPFSAEPSEFANMVHTGNEMRRVLDAGV